MLSPFEELEYLADYLPDEGESVVMSRRSGELVCEALPQPEEPSLLSDAELYGRLVVANERLRRQTLVPIWVGLLVSFWACVGLHSLAGIGWNEWYFFAGLGLIAFAGVVAWIDFLQLRLYRYEVRPMVQVQIQRRGINLYSLVTAIGQAPELRTLMNVLSRWSD